MAVQSPRIFRPVDSDIYKLPADGPEGQWARLAHTPLTFRQRYFGLGLEKQLLLSRILTIHRQAAEEEMEGRAASAALLFEEATRLSERLWANQRLLHESLRAIFGDGVSDDEVALRGESLLRDVLAGVSLHFASRAETADPRRERHLTIADRFLALGEGSAEKAELRDAIAACRFGARWDSKQFSAAAAVAEGAADRTSAGIWTARAALAHFSGFVEALGEASDDLRRQTAVCSNAAAAVALLRNRHPLVREVYQCLGEIYRVYAISCANRDQLCQAIEKARLACVHAPRSPEMHDILQQIYAKADAVAGQIEQAEREIAGKAGVQLSSEARELKREAGLAQALKLEWPDTESSRWIVEHEAAAADHPYALDFLADAGAALDRFLPSSPSPLPEATRDRERALDWLFAARSYPQKAVLALGAVLLVISGAAYATDSVGKAARARHYPRIVAAAEAGDAATVAKDGHAFLSATVIGADPRDPDVRAMVAAAEDRLGPRQRRDEAARTVEAAQQAGRIEAVLTAGEAFFDNLPGSVDDPRRTQVATTYRRAFNSWLLAGSPNPKDAHLAAFRRLEPVLDRNGS